jgi:hypothetical protein
MAIDAKDTHTESADHGRRFAVAVNVVIAVAVAAALLGAVNFIGAKKSIRKDLASAGNYGISDRTKRIVEGCDEPVKLSLLYEPDEADEKQTEYIDRLLDYCDEFERLAPDKIDVTHVTRSGQIEKLVARISSSFGGKAGPHQEAIESFNRLRGELETELQRVSGEGQALLGEPSWLGSFPIFAQVVMKLQEITETLSAVAGEIEELTPAGGIPNYAEAATKAAGAAKEIGNTIRSLGGFLSELNGLADEVSKADSRNIAMLRNVATEGSSAIEALRRTVGGNDDPEPADITAALKAFADEGVKVGTTLEGLVREVDAFADRFPLVTQHADWSTKVKSGPMVMQREVTSVLQDAGRSLKRIRLTLLGVIDTNDPAQLRQALSTARRNTSILEQNTSVCSQILTSLADRLSSLDDGSKQLVASARDGQFLKARIDALDALVKEIEALPELTQGSVADELREANAVVIEIGDKIRVVGFAAVWPVRESLAGPSGGGEEEMGRTFNGDSVISSAILAMAADRPFATVTLVSYEPPAPQQRSPFMPPPPRSIIPAQQLTTVRERLEAANFKVQTWNMATDEQKPDMEEGATEILIVLPPAPQAQPNPFGGPPPAPGFTDTHRQKVRGLLDKGGRALFLTSWEVAGGGFGGRPRTPPYPYAPILEQDWGLRIRNDLRMVEIDPDLETADGFRVALPKFQHLPVNGFADHVIGKPMRGTRFLITDACSIERTEATPDGVDTQTVLSIPQREQFIGATVDEIIQIVNRLNDPKGDGVVRLDTRPTLGPFDLMVTSHRRVEDHDKGRIAVIAFGGSLRDAFVNQDVLANADPIRFAPPPTENLDLLVNAVYWLNDQGAYIGRGPVPVPRVQAIDPGELKLTKFGVMLLWPLVAISPGVILWFIRRR